MPAYYYLENTLIKQNTLFAEWLGCWFNMNCGRTTSTYATYDLAEYIT